MAIAGRAVVEAHTRGVAVVVARPRVVVAPIRVGGPIVPIVAVPMVAIPPVSILHGRALADGRLVAGCGTGRGSSLHRGRHQAERERYCRTDKPCAPDHSVSPLSS